MLRSFSRRGCFGALTLSALLWSGLGYASPPTEPAIELGQPDGLVLADRAAAPDRAPAVDRVSVADRTPVAAVAPAADRAPATERTLAERPGPAWDGVSQRANGHIRYAFDLAGRGAVYSAQTEFLRALRLVAEILDTGAESQEHSLALEAGLRAMAEAEDFVPEEAQRGAAISLQRRIATHRTPVLHDADPQKLTALVALRSYYTYAKEQLALAGDRQKAASLALYGLACLQAVIGRSMSIPKAVTLYQAAIAVDANNYLAANDLAVLMCHSGELEEARMLLVHSSKLSVRSETLYNLTVVCQQLGRMDEAQAARRLYENALAAERARELAGGPTGGMIYWVDNEKLIRAPDATGGDPPQTASHGSAKGPAAGPTSPGEKSGESSWSSAISRGLTSLGLGGHSTSTGSND